MQQICSSRTSGRTWRGLEIAHLWRRERHWRVRVDRGAEVLDEQMRVGPVVTRTSL
jgi:hypothetical protein